MTDCRDRTTEFFQFLNTVKVASPTPASPQALESPLLDYNGQIAKPASNPLGHKTKFTRFAQDIARRIHGCAEKMEKLTHLAKQRRNFDDPANQIDLLASQINGDLKTLNQEIEALEKFGNQKSDDKIKTAQEQTHNHKIVEGLQLDLGLATKGFTEILQLRTKNLKHKNERREAYSGSGTRRRTRRAQMTMNDHSLVLPDTKDGSSETIDETGEHCIEIDTAELTQQQAERDEDTYLQSRGQAVENIEKTIAELSTMYKRLVQIVSMQGEMTERIDQNVTDAQVNVELAETELWKLHQSYSSSQWLILKVFLFLIIFSVFFIVFVA
eukprot:gb/GEZN01012456.1/.p1 GENE.gb/GEZN01012456.1/~~gb/GEZN01012456.1/.p1  ORF type:complete len:350 (-),score=49.99 gb/GEZN01012456.1/:30-1010(-)